MITLTAKIELLGASTAQKTRNSGGMSATVTADAINISSGIGDTINKRPIGKKFFRLCSTPFKIPFKNQGTLQTKLPYFVGRFGSDVNANINIILTLPEGVKQFNIVFDEANDIYPSTIYLSTTKPGATNSPYTVYSANQQVTIPDDIFNNLGNSQLKISISKLYSRDKQLLVIQSIYTQVDIDIDYRMLTSLSTSIVDREDTKYPSYGIVSNTGLMEFIDGNGEILEYINKELIKSGMQVRVFLNNTLTDSHEQVALFETDEWRYDNENRVVSVSLKDDLEEWQDIYVEGIPYNPLQKLSQPLSWFYEYLWILTDRRANGNYTMQSLTELDNATKEILETIYVEYPLLNSGSLWQQWDKLCKAGQLHIYKNSEGIVVCRYNGGN